VSSISMHKSALRINSYFHILALCKSFNENLQPKLVNQELQTINYIKTNINILFISLLSKTSGYSYPRVAAIWIDVHPAGKTWYTWHIRFSRQSTYATHTLPVDIPRMWQPFGSRQQRWTNPMPEKKRAPVLIHSTIADRFMDLYPVSLS
jgi:hypothetical protein